MHGMKSRILKLRNYGLFKSADVEIKPGVSVVFGYWDDDFLHSNGAGKSMLVGSLLYAFTGKSPRMPWQDSFGVRFETEKYTIVRERSGRNSKVEFLYDGNVYTGRMRDVASVISSMFGDESVLATLYFALEGTQLDFWRMTPSARYSFLQEVFRLSDIDDYKQKAVLFVRDKKREVENLESDIVTLEEKISEYKTKLAGLDKTVLLRHAQQLREKLQKLEEKYNKEEKELRHVLELMKKRENLMKDYMRLSARIEQQKARKKALMEQLDEIQKKLENIRPILNKYQNYDFDEHIKKFKEQESSLQQVLDKLRADKIMVLEKKKLLDAGKCPTCGRPFTKHDYSALSLPDVSKLDAAISENTEKLANVKEKIDRLMQARARFVELERQYKELMMKRDAIKNELASLQEHGMASLYELQKELKELEESLSGIDHNELMAVHKKHFVEISRLKEEEKELERQLSTIELYEEELKNIQGRLDNLRKQHKIITEGLPAYERIAFYFSSGMVLNSFLTEILGKAEERANSFLAAINSDLRIMFGSNKLLKSGRKKPEIVLDIKRGNSTVMPSSGEGTIVSIALRLAFAELHGKLDFFVFDESFAFLDDYNAAMVIDALHAVLDFGYYGVIVVSNKQLLREMSGVNHIVIRRTGDESIVVSN